VINHDVFAIEPWTLRERQMHLDLLAQSESIFALSNGHIGLRGNLDEGEPNAVPGSYLNGFFETLPLPYAEGGYGYPEEGQSLIDVTNGKLIRLLVDDEPFDIRYGTLHRHERVLDFRDGVLRREAEWTSPAGQAVVVRSTRLVSFVQRSIAAILYEVEPRGAPARIVAQSALVANDARSGITVPSRSNWVSPAKTRRTTSSSTSEAARIGSMNCGELVTPSMYVTPSAGTAPERSASSRNTAPTLTTAKTPISAMTMNLSRALT